MFTCPQCATPFSEGPLSDQPIRCPRCGTELQATVHVADLRELQRDFAQRDSVTPARADAGKAPDMPAAPD